MFTEELEKINEAEERAEQLKREAKAEAKAMVEKATCDAQRILTDAEKEAHLHLEDMLKQGETETKRQYAEAIESAERDSKALEDMASALEGKAINLVVERIVRASVDS